MYVCQTTWVMVYMFCCIMSYQPSDACLLGGSGGMPPMNLDGFWHNLRQDCCLIPVTKQQPPSQFQDFWGEVGEGGIPAPSPPLYETLASVTDCWMAHWFIIRVSQTWFVPMRFFPVSNENFIYLSIHLSIHLSIYLSIYLSDCVHNL